MKKLFTTFMLVILLASTISAFYFDNVKDYDKENEKITVGNAFGLGKDLAIYELTYNTNECLINCEARGNAEILDKDYLFTGIKFRDYNNIEKELDFHIYIETTEIIEWENPIEEYECDAPETNCVLVNTEYETMTEEKVSWEEYDGKQLDVGNYTWKITAKKDKDESVDWVASAFGEEFSEWAWWNANWANRKEVNVTGGEESLTNFTVYINVTYDSDMQVDFEDLRFVNGSCSSFQDTELSYEFDTVVDSSSAGAWIKIPTLNTGTNQICMYYGNGAAGNGEDKDGSWDSNYMGVWHFSEGTGTTTQDSITLNNHSFGGDPTWTSSRFGLGNALTFDINDYIALPAANTLIDITTDNITIEAWYYTLGADADQQIIGGGNNAFDYQLKSDNKIRFAEGGVLAIASTDNYEYNKTKLGQVYRIYPEVSFFNNKTADSGNTQTLATGDFVSGDYYIGKSSGGFNGDLDEIRVSNIARSIAWLERSYDNQDTTYFTFGAEDYGEGIVFLTLNSPADAIETLNTTIYFATAYSFSDGNMTNSTTYVWSSDGTLVNSSLTLITGMTNSTNVSISNLPVNDSYSWNVFACGLDGNLNTNCTWNSANRTFDIKLYTQNSETYNASELEMGSTTFKINISAQGDEAVTANFYYNNVSQGAGTQSGHDAEMVFTKTITVPIGVQNNSFNWEIIKGTDRGNSSHQNQEVNGTYFDLCNATVTIPILNITFQDEGTLTAVNASIPLSTFNYYLGAANINKTLTYTNTPENTSYAFCTNVDRTFNVDPYMQYKNSLSPQRTWDPSVTAYSSATTNQTLYLLPTADGVYQNFQVYSASGSVVSGALANCTREIGGEQIVVASGSSDGTGIISFWLNSDFIHYCSFWKSGYGSYSTSINPIGGDTKQITLSGEGTTAIPVIDYSRGIIIGIEPTDEFINANTIYDFNYSIATSGYWDLDEFGYIIKNFSGDVLNTQSSTTSTGGVLTVNLNTSNNQKIIMDYYYVINSTYLNKSKTFIMINPNDFSIMHFFDDLGTYMDTDMFGLLGDDNGEFIKALLSVLILILVTGIFSYKYGVNSSEVIIGIMFGVVFLLNSLNFIPNPAFLTIIDLGDFLVFIIGILTIVMLFRGESR